MQRKGISTDGFVVRRRTGAVGQRPRATLDSSNAPVPSQFLVDPHSKKAGAVPMLKRPTATGQTALSPAIGASLPAPRQEKIDIDMTLDDEGKQPSRRGRRNNKQQTGKKKPSIKKIIKWSAIAILVIGVGVGGYFGYKLLTTSGKIFKGNAIAALFDPGQPLQEDENGRSNILLFGTSEDDPGHDAPDLTDSIMVASIDQDKKDVFIVSIPRDLHVQYGRACVAGYQGKINTLYGCGKASGGEDEGAKVLREKVGEILGLDVQYSVHVNYTVLRQAVAAVGGIRVTIESVDPRGQMDSNFDWKCGVGDRKVSRAEVLKRCPPNGHYIDYPNGPVDLDAEHALYLAQARGDGALTYGFPRSNPDRQDNQRKILIALKDKAVSAGVLANPVTINSLLDALGDNLRTTFEANEIKTLVQLGKDVKSEEITSFSLEDKEHPLTTVSCNSGNVCPNAGANNYSAIHEAIKALSTGDKASRELAKIDVLNASGTAGLAQTQADKLTAENLKVGIVGNAATSLGTKPVQFYDLSGGKKPATLAKLKKLLNVEVTSGTPAGVSSTADFVVIMGAQPTPATDTNSGQ